MRWDALVQREKMDQLDFLAHLGQLVHKGCLDHQELREIVEMMGLLGLLGLLDLRVNLVDEDHEEQKELLVPQVHQDRKD